MPIAYHHPILPNKKGVIFLYFQVIQAKRFSYFYNPYDIRAPALSAQSFRCPIAGRAIVIVHANRIADFQLVPRFQLFCLDPASLPHPKLIIPSDQNTVFSAIFENIDNRVDLSIFRLNRAHDLPIALLPSQGAARQDFRPDIYPLDRRESVISVNQGA